MYCVDDTRNMETFKEQIIKRLKSFAWRAGMMLLAIVVNTALEYIASFNLGAELTLILGLVLGELSKYLNNYQVKR